MLFVAGSVHRPPQSKP